MFGYCRLYIHVHNISILTADMAKKCTLANSSALITYYIRECNKLKLMYKYIHSDTLIKTPHRNCSC